MPYHYLEDIATADVAFEATGKDLEELFISAADATMNVMVSDLESIDGTEQVEFEVDHEELDMLLFNFLQELIFYKDARCLLLRVESAAVGQTSGKHTVTARAVGEKLDQQRHDLIVDVKAVTLYRFSLRQIDDGWTTTVVLDI